MRTYLKVLLSFLMLLAFFAAGEEIIKLETDPVTYIQIIDHTCYDDFNLLDADMNLIMEDYFDYFSGFDENGIAVARQDILYGYFKSDGNWLIEPQFSYADEFSEGAARVKVDGLFGYVKSDGTWLTEPSFFDASNFNCGLAAVKTELVVQSWGYIDKDGEFAIAPAFDEAFDFAADGIAIAALDIPNPDFSLERNRKYGIIDTEGNWIVEPRFDKVYSFNDDGIARVLEDRQYGYVKSDGTIVAETTYNDARDFNNGFAAVKNDSLEHAWGYLNTYGEFAIAPSFDYAEDFIYGTAVVGINIPYPEYPTIQYTKYGVIDTEGNTVIDFLYNSIWLIYLHDNVYLPFYVFETNGLYGLADIDGNMLLEPVYTDIDVGYDYTILEATSDNSIDYYNITDNSIESIIIVTSSMNKSDYYPNYGRKVVTSDEPYSVDWDENHELPMLDGATGLLPVYSAWVQAVYPAWVSYEEVKYPYLSEQKILITCSKTAKAYERLINRECDIIFCLEPSEEELELAKNRGIELEYTPIGYESFVFIVNTENPIDGMSTDEIKSIYSGKITDWSTFGYPELGEIQAYQREPNSGSQTTFVAFMGDTPIMKAPGEYYSDGMSTIVNTIEYRNYPNAIGFTFRFFLTEMMHSNLKMLSIDGVSPTIETISNGTYPLTSTLYAVTIKGNDNPNIAIFLDWATSEQGQKLLEKSGYVPFEVQD